MRRQLGVAPSNTADAVTKSYVDGLAYTGGSSSNADTATKLATARTINGVAFDGTANITINAVDSTAREPSISAGTTSQYWRGDKTWQTLNQDSVPDGTTNKAYTATEKTKLANITGTNTGDQTNITGNAGTATKLATAQTINGVSFDGSAAITINAVDATAREPSITAGTTSQYWRGDKSFQTLNQDVVPDGTTNKAYTATEKTKLAGIATGATANSSDATLENRANHTGTQTSSTISDFSTAVNSLITATSPVTGSVNGTATALTLWTGTSAQYTALGTYSSSTVYIVTP